MGMDRNTTIGFVLIGILLIGMFYFNSKNRLAYEGQQKRIADSIAKLNPPVVPSAKKATDSTVIYNTQNVAPSGFGLPGDAEEFPVLENDVVKITFTNKGAQPKSVVLKKFKKFDGSSVILNQGEFNKLSYRINNTQNHSTAIEDIRFKVLPVKNNEGGQTPPQEQEKIFL